MVYYISIFLKLSKIIYIYIRLRKEIVMALIDIHTHILYGVDDGAKDINDSMGLLDEEREQGVDQVILTPHYGPKF